MKISDELQSNKIAIMRAATDAMARYGNGYEIKINACFLVVDIVLIDFDAGVLKGTECFSVDLQTGPAETCYDVTMDRMVKYLRRLGAEFTTIQEFIDEAKNILRENYQ
jgi:hypothetical protein